MFDAGVWVLNVGLDSFNSRLDAASDAAQIRHPRFAAAMAVANRAFRQNGRTKPFSKNA
jgi:hypothetical protein